MYFNGYRDENAAPKGVVTQETASTPMSWARFRGNRLEYDEYMAEFESGNFLKWDRWGNKAGDTFTCAASEIDGCPLQAKEAANPLVQVPWELYQKWIYLCRKFTTEWIAYLKGTKNPETGIWTITEMYFPKQRANQSHVDVIDDTNQVTEGTIGSVHSHVSMSAFFSAEDKRHFNHDVEIVCNRSGDLACAVRIKLECGRFGRLGSAILLTGTDNIAGIMNDLTSKLVEETPARAIPITSGNQGSN